jgi:hypothetical protein
MPHHSRPETVKRLERVAFRCARGRDLRPARVRQGRALAPARLVLVAVATLAFGHCAHAHGIAGNRYFPGTLTFDDPAVADELLFGPTSLKHPGEGTDVRDTSVGWSFMRLLTPDLAVGAGGGWIHRAPDAFPAQ